MPPVQLTASFSNFRQSAFSPPSTDLPASPCESAALVLTVLLCPCVPAITSSLSVCFFMRNWVDQKHKADATKWKQTCIAYQLFCISLHHKGQLLFPKNKKYILCNFTVNLCVRITSILCNSVTTSDMDWTCSTEQTPPWAALWHAHMQMTSPPWITPQAEGQTGRLWLMHASPPLCATTKASGHEVG